MAGATDLNWVTVIQTLSWAGAAVTAAIGAATFLLSQKKARVQREEEIIERRAANATAERELQWRQAGAAQASLEKMEDDELAADAMMMLDWDGRYFPSRGPQWRLRKADVLRALRTGGPPFNHPETYVRDAFDRLFWHFERIQSQIDVKLIALRHVRFPLAYWVALIDEDRDVYYNFLTAYGYEGAPMLMDALRQMGLPTVSANYEELFNRPEDADAPSPSQRHGGRYVGESVMPGNRS
jgi:hypothetical protein